MQSERRTKRWCTRTWDRQSASGASPVAWVLAWLLFGLLPMLPGLGLAQSNGLSVQPAGVSLFEKAPREVVTSVFRITNRTRGAALFESRLHLPPDWRRITPDFPFRVAAGATTVQLVSFLVPPQAAAGDYQVRYQVTQRDRPAVSSATLLRIRVLPVWELQVEALSVPRLVIAGEPFRASYRINNHSNTALHVGFRVDSQKGTPIEPSAGALVLAAGASETVELTVTPGDKGCVVNDRLSLNAPWPRPISAIRWRPASRSCRASAPASLPSTAFRPCLRSPSAARSAMASVPPARSWLGPAAARSTTPANGI